MKNTQVITTRRETNNKISQDEKKKKDEPIVENPGEDTEETLSNSEIASLQAKLAQQRQAYAKRPRVKTLTSVATRASVDAEYLNLWQEKIELIGNLNYPQEARRKKIYGQLRLVVSLLPDGSIHNIEILQSSGQRILGRCRYSHRAYGCTFCTFPSRVAQRCRPTGNYSHLEI
jgi:protein TonB